MITKITSFSSIHRFQKALYIFDIDDTARNINFKSITESHLEQLNINSTQVYYFAGQNKGTYLKKYY